MRDFEGLTTIAKSRILLPLPRNVRAFFADVGLFSVSPGSQFNYNISCLTYHRRCEVDGMTEPASCGSRMLNQVGTCLIYQHSN